MALVELPELSNFKLLDLIGCGGMGYVCIGIQLDADKLAAIKFLSPEAAKSQVALTQFKQESNILKRLNHPNIVGFIGQGCENGYNYLAMEYVKGLSLDSFPLSSSLTACSAAPALPTLEEYLNVFIGCFDALSYIHKLGLVHRDIKPRNIILRGSEYKPCLIDFGISKYVADEDDLMIPADNMFTAAYASPEQLTSKPAEPTSDLFSFGVVMYEKLTGHLPFNGKRAMQVFIEQTKWKFAPPRQLNPRVPRKLEQIILKLLAKDPQQRYPTAQMVSGELKHLLDATKQTTSGLTMSSIMSEIRSVNFSRRSFKKTTLSEEKAMLKKQGAEIVETRAKLKSECAKALPDAETVENLKILCDTLLKGYDRLKKQIKMALGFKSQPVVIDKFNSIFKLETIAFEKRGVPFTLNTIEQKLTTTDGNDIIVGGLNFTERARCFFSINQKDNFLSWDQSNWFFGGFEEHEFPIFLMLGDKTVSRCPPTFRGFFWPIELLTAIKKLGFTGISIVESFKGVDRNGVVVSAEHKETILFAQSLFDYVNSAGAEKGSEKN